MAEPTVAVAPPALEIGPAGAFAHADILVLSPTPTAPIDQGNRKRIHAVCHSLQRRGARIHFVYYPAEWWFSFVPPDLVDRMRSQWDSFHLLHTTRPHHPPSIGADHTIDEWWDPCIGAHLQWLFARQRFDAFIVNYTYLSKALEFAPPGVLRILDTHDQFTGRRALLQAQGIAPEFFHTTQEEEAIAVARADLVWAIKEQEAAFFRTLSQTPCITLPHVEPVAVVPRRPRPKDDGSLVVGMIGAYNSINITNVRLFVEQVLSQLQRQLAPVRLRLGGSMCEALGDLAAKPGVDLIGRVADVCEFYAAIDVAIVPMVFSTGLKIKAVEALAHGMPMVAMAHAVEGIPVAHRFQCCGSMAEMTEALIELAFDAAERQALRDAADEAHRRLQQMAEAAFGQTQRMIGAQRRIVFLVDAEFLRAASLYREHVIHCIHALKHLGQIVLHFDQPIEAGQSLFFERFNSLAPWAKAAFDPRTNPALPASVGIVHFMATLAELLALPGVRGAWAFRLPPVLPEVVPALAAGLAFYVRSDALRLLPSDDAARVGEWLRHFPRAALVDCADVQGSLPAPTEEATMRVPFWRWKPGAMGVPAYRIDILASRGTLAIAMVLAEEIDEAWPHFAASRLLVADDVDAKARRHPPVRMHEALADFAQIQCPPCGVIDLSGEAGLAAVYLETVVRAGARVWRPEDWQGWLAAGGLTVSGLLESVDGFIREAMQRGTGSPSEAARYDNDAGWTTVWRRFAEDARRMEA